MIAAPSIRAVARAFTRIAAVGALLAPISTIAACAGPERQTPVVAPTLPTRPVVDVDADPVALLPSGPLGAAYVDGHAFATSTNGGDLLAIADRLMPFARDIDFDVKRDLAGVWIAGYSFTGADVVAVVTGTFKPDKIEAAAQKGLKTPFGIAVGSSYAGHKIYTVANFGFTSLSAKTALVGSEPAIRRALDRIQAGTVKRELDGWLGDWVVQPGYPLTFAGDVSRQSPGKTVTSMLPWIDGMKYVRGRARFNADGSLGMSGSLTFPDAAKAKAAADGLGGLGHSMMTMAALKAFGIDPLFRKLECTPSGSDAQFATVVDEKGTRQLVRTLSDWVDGVMPASK
jgi:hypothetical protein